MNLKKHTIDKAMKFAVMNKVCAFVLTLFLCGCTLLPPRADPARYYVLETAVSGSVKKTTDGMRPKVALSVARAQLPAYLDRLEIATRLSAHRLAIHDTERWLEPLGKAFTRVFAHNLAQHLGTEQMAVAPAVSTAGDDINVQVDVIQFDGPASGEISLRARWTLVRVLDGQMLSTQQDEVKRKVGAGAGYDGYVDAMSQALDAFAGLVAQDICRVTSPRQ